MILNQLLEKLQKIQNNRQLLRKCCKNNQLPITMLNGFTNNKILLIYDRLHKHYHDHPEKAKTVWFENELKIFFWVVLSVSLLQNLKIQDFKDQQWFFIKSIFTQKEVYTFKYQTKRILTSGRKNSRVWNQQQNNFLKEIMCDLKMKNKWNQVARIFYEKSNHKYFRTGKQCRQHWLNHLDPSKKHGKWDNKEDQNILKYVFSNGKKWSLIAKEIIINRTQHMIKNRFKALIFKEKKLMGVNQVDEGKILKRIIRKFTQNDDKQLQQNDQKINFQQPQHQQNNQNNFQGPQKFVENSVPQYITEISLNNINFYNMYTFMYFLPQPVQLVRNVILNKPLQNEIQYYIQNNSNQEININKFYSNNQIKNTNQIVRQQTSIGIEVEDNQN